MYARNFSAKAISPLFTITFRRAIEKQLSFHARFIEGNLADSKKLREAFKSFSVGSIMHFAADCQVGESVENPLKYFNNNVKNSLQLAEMMMECNIRKLIFSSSAAVYGEPKKLPIPEEHPCLPVNPNILTFRVL